MMILNKRILLVSLSLLSIYYSLAQVQPKKLICFPTDELISVDQAVDIIIDKHWEQKTDTFYDNGRQHWFVFKIDSIPWKGETVISVPDYQINHLQIYKWRLGVSPKLVFNFGDEINVSQYTMKTRTWQCIVKDLSSKDLLLVRYERPGNRTQLLIKLYSKDGFLIKWRTNKKWFGLVYGIILLYLLGLIITVVLIKEKSGFMYYFLWVLSYSLYFLFSTGHIKFYFFSEHEKFFSGYRVFVILLGFFAMTQYSLIHYNKKQQLKFVSYIWYGWLLFSIILLSYNYFASENIYLGFEKEFIAILRFLFLFFLVVQTYLPISHYRKTKKITFLTPVLLSAFIFTLIYLFQTIRLEQIDFNKYILQTIWFHIIEIIVIAVGLGKHFFQEKKVQEELEKENERLQLQLNVTQFEVRETERKRTAIDLHDDVMNRLAILLQLFDGKYINKEEARIRIHDITADIRMYISGLYPQWINELGLQEIVNNNFLSLFEKKGFILDFYLDGDESKLKRVKKIQLYRVIQEFIYNFFKYSSGNTVKVMIIITEDKLTCVMSENGEGYDMNDVKQGLGNIGAMNRIQIIGGNMKIFAGEELNGVRWDLYFPLD